VLQPSRKQLEGQESNFGGSACLANEISRQKIVEHDTAPEHSTPHEKPETPRTNAERASENRKICKKGKENEKL
jgi:hypothetical protein